MSAIAAQTIFEPACGLSAFVGDAVSGEWSFEGEVKGP